MNKLILYDYTFFIMRSFKPMQSKEDFLMKPHDLTTKLKNYSTIQIIHQQFMS